MFRVCLPLVRMHNSKKLKNTFAVNDKRLVDRRVIECAGFKFGLCCELRQTILGFWP